MFCSRIIPYVYFCCMMSSNIVANDKTTCDFFAFFCSLLVGRVIERLKWGSETSLRRFVVKRPKRQQNYNGQEAGGGGRTAQKICTIESETWILPGSISFKRPLQNSEALEFSVHAIHSVMLTGLQIYANRFPRLKPTEFWACYMFVVAAPFWLSWPCFFFPPSLPTSSASRWESLCVEWRCHVFLLTVLTLTCDDDASMCFFRSGWNGFVWK